MSSAKLIAAIQGGDVTAVKRILELQPASVHGRHPLGQHTPLHAAAALGSLHVVRELLSVGGPSAAQALDEGGATALHVACQQGHLAVVKELLADAGRRSCMKAVNRDGATPLHLAAAAGHHGVVAALVNAGARTDARDRAGRTPLDVVDAAVWPCVAEVLAAGRRALTPAGAGRSRSRTAGTTSPGSSARSSQASPLTLHRVTAKLNSEAQGAPQLLLPADHDQHQHHDQQAVSASNGKSQGQRRQRQQWQQPTSSMAAGAGCPPGYMEPQQPSMRPGTVCVAPGTATSAAAMAAVGNGSGAQLHWQQQHAAPPAAPLGPLRSAQAAGPGSAGAAAAAAVNGLTRTFVHQPQLSHGGSMRQWCGPGDEHAPSDAGCLPTSRLQPDASATSMRDASASAAAAATCTPRHLQQPPTPQGSPLAALAAAVSATGRTGPLQLPLQLQLGELASKVHQLEAWFESQAELIPAWREVLSAVQGLERSMEEQQVKQEEHLDQAARHDAALTAIAAQLAALDEAGVLAAVSQQKELAALCAMEHQTLKVCVAEYAEQVKQLQAQLAMQASSSAAQRTADDGQMQTVWQRLHSLEASLRELQQQGAPGVAAISDDGQVVVGNSAAAGSAEADARLLALEASVAELRHLLLEQQQQQAALCPMPTTPGGTSVSSRVAAIEAASCDKAARSPALRSSTTAEQLRELRQQVAAVSASVSGLARAAPLQSGGMDEALLSFMETTGSCLQRHEQQLEEMQAMLPQLDVLATQQAAVSNLQEQLATLQTAFDLATGARPSSGGGAKDTRLLLGGGPLGSHKAAAEISKSAASMVQLQSQMGKLQSQLSTLSAAVEELHLEWESASASMSAECDAVRCAWEAEASRLKAAEAEAARDLAEQRQELLAREDRLVQLREAAMAEEAARQRQVEHAAHLTEALKGLQDGHQQLSECVITLEAKSADVQLQLAALQADLHDVAATAAQAAVASTPQPPAACDPAADESGAAAHAAGSEDTGAPASDPAVNASNPFLSEDPPAAAAELDAVTTGEADAAPQQHGYQPGTYWTVAQEADDAAGGSAAAQAAVVAAADVVCHVGAQPSAASAGTTAADAAAAPHASSSWLGRALSSRKGSKAAGGATAQPAGTGGAAGVVKLFSSRHSKAEQQEPAQELFGDELLLRRVMSGGGSEGEDGAQPSTGAPPVLAGSGRWRKKKPWQRLVRDTAPV